MVYPESYLNDVRFDLRILTQGVAYITDSSDEGFNGIVVVDLDSGTSWRRLDGHNSTRATPRFVPSVSGMPIRLKRNETDTPGYITTGSDGLAISSDGLRLYYCPLASRRLYSVSTRILAAPSATDNDTIATIAAHGEKGGTSDGLESDNRGNLYMTNQEQNAIFRGFFQNQTLIVEPFVRDPRIQWADTLSIGWNEKLYFTVNQLHLQPKYWGGKDMRVKPYVLYSVDLGHGAGRVSLTCDANGNELMPCSAPEDAGSKQAQCRC